MIHLVGLPHTQLSPDYSSCAFTAKAFGFLTLMELCGREVTAYWGGSDTGGGRSFVSIVDPEDQVEWFGAAEDVRNDPAGSIEFDAKKDRCDQGAHQARRHRGHRRRQHPAVGGQCLHA
jgi:hypothetical protein